MKNSVLSKIALLLIFAALIIPTGNVSAWEYVSFNGKFKISLPEGWQRVDYRTVDYLLSQSATDSRVMQYEAVFAPHDDLTFVEQDYLILTLDKVGNLNDEQKDSVVRELGGVFGKGLKYAPVGDLMTNLRTGSPAYDEKTNSVSILSDVADVNGQLRKSLLIIKFYDSGIANFYFYAPDSLYSGSKEVFAGIISSFSTDDLEPEGSPEKIKVAELKDKDDNGSMIPVWIGLGVVLMVVIISRRKKRKQS